MMNEDDTGSGLISALLDEGEVDEGDVDEGELTQLLDEKTIDEGGDEGLTQPTLHLPPDLEIPQDCLLSDLPPDSGPNTERDPVPAHLNQLVSSS